MSPQLYTFHNDYHLFGVNQLMKPTPENIARIFHPENELEYDIGDNWELENCEYKDVNLVQHYINKYAKLYGPKRFNPGNHGVQHDRDFMMHINEDVGVMHGDEICWPLERSIKFRAGEPGAGFLKRQVWGRLIADHNGNISREDMERFEAVAIRENKKKIIIGHTHIKDTETFERGGRKLVALKRGTNQLWL